MQEKSSRTEKSVTSINLRTTSTGITAAVQVMEFCGYRSKDPSECHDAVLSVQLLPQPLLLKRHTAGGCTCSSALLELAMVWCGDGLPDILVTDALSVFGLSVVLWIDISWGFFFLFSFYLYFIRIFPCLMQPFSHQCIVNSIFFLTWLG